MFPLTPRYLTLDYIKKFIEDKVNINDTDLSAISEEVANDLIASAESEVIYEFLNHFKFPTPLEFDDLATAYPDTYAELVNLLRAKSIVRILEYYYGKVGEGKGKDYIENANKTYTFLFNRLLRKLDNGLYAYLNMPGLEINPDAVIKKNLGQSITGLIGGQSQIMADYAQNQILDPRNSFTQNWNF